MPHSISSFYGSTDFICFAFRYFFPNEKLDWTWELHGGSTGHLPYALRRQRTDEATQKLFETFEAYQEKLQVQMGQILNISTILNKIFAHAASHSDTPKSALPKSIKYQLVTGFSRSGGTYLTNEFAKIFNINSLQNGIFWCHDFYPFFSINSYNNENPLIHHNSNTQTVFHLATVIAYLIDATESTFVKRSVLGSCITPFAQEISQCQEGFTFDHAHIIRDINGIIPSLDKMYEGMETSNLPDLIYGEPVSIDHPFLKVATKWFIANLSILPNPKNLPCINVPIDFSTSPNAIANQVRSVTDRYLLSTKPNPFKRSEKQAPTLIKYGSTTISDLQQIGKALNPEYNADTLNYSEKVTIDSPYQPVYQAYLEAITRLYQHAGIDFDGHLEQV